MAAAPKENLGKIPCPCCGDPVALKKSATGKLSYACQDANCESTGFADQHSGAARKWTAALAPTAPAPASTPPAAKTPPVPAPPAATPPKKPPAVPFSLGSL